MRRRIVKFAVLGWGSLIWDPRELKIAAKFAPNGPLLPIEFCRVSKDGRFTYLAFRAPSKFILRPLRHLKIQMIFTAQSR